MTIRWWARATIDAFGASDLDDDVLAVAELDDLDAEVTPSELRWRDGETGRVRPISGRLTQARRVCFT